MTSAEDKVIAEFDAYVCNGVLGSQTQVCLFQYPLRPPWRPYDVADGRTKMRVKPKAQRIEMTLPMDTRSENYHYGIDEALRINQLTLRSRPSELASTVAMGVFRDGKLLLLPVGVAHRLRPTMDHLDVPVTQPTGKTEKKEVKPEPGSEPETVALQPQYKKKETERQAQQRMSSYAYLSEEAAKEAWVQIDVAEPGVEENFFDQLANTPSDQLRTTLSRDAYFATLTPSPAEHGEQDAELVAAHRSAEDASAPGATPVTRPEAEAKPSEPELPLSEQRYSGPPLSEAEAKALKKTLTQLLRHNPVVKLRGIRWWLLTSKSLTPLDRLFTGSDVLLHQAALQSGLLTYVREVYVQTATDDQEVSALRKVVLQLLGTKPAVKKQEILSAAKEAGSTLSDVQCLKAVKEICQSRAAMWVLKPGFAGKS